MQPNGRPPAYRVPRCDRCNQPIAQHASVIYNGAEWCICPTPDGHAADYEHTMALAAGHGGDGRGE